MPIPLKGVVWFGVESGGKAFAGDCGVLNAELRLAVKPCILGVRDAAGPPIVNEAMPDKGSIYKESTKVGDKIKTRENY